MVGLLTRQPKPQTKFSDEPSEAYLALVRDLQITHTLPSSNRMVTLLRKLNMPIYNNNEVDSYMRRITPRRKQYYWSLLLGSFAHSWLYEKQDKPGHYAPQVYRRPVPHHILQRVKTIRDHMPQATFFVTDYAVVNPDPFVCVRDRDNTDAPHVVFGVWDEPGFGSSPEV